MNYLRLAFMCCWAASLFLAFEYGRTHIYTLYVDRNVALILAGGVLAAFMGMVGVPLLLTP